MVNGNLVLKIFGLKKIKSFAGFHKSRTFVIELMIEFFYIKLYWLLVLVLLIMWLV